jgi:hypothetical protein
VGSWKVWLSEDEAGSLNGVLVTSLNAAMPMLGPGVAADEGTSKALFWSALDALRGQTYVVLVPAEAQDLVRTLYQWGGRNVELHVAQAYGDTPVGRGIAFPTFLPETA